MAITPTRASKRLKSIEDSREVGGSAAKLSYVDVNSDEESGSEDDYQAEEDDTAQSSPEDEASEESFNEEDTKPRQRNARRSIGIARGTKSKSKTDDRNGSGTGLGPGREVIVRMPKPRLAGKTPYEPHRIHPNTLLFLKDLAQNNSRDWLKGAVPLSPANGHTPSQADVCSQLMTSISVPQRRTSTRSLPF